MKRSTWTVIGLILLVTPAAPIGGLILFFTFLGWVASWETDEYAFLNEPEEKSNSSSKKTGYMVYKSYGSNTQEWGPYPSPSSAISNARGILGRASKGTAVSVVNLSNGSSVWSDNK